MNIQFPTSFNVCFCTTYYLGKADQAKYALKYTKTWKNIPNIIDRTLKKINKF